MRKVAVLLAAVAVACSGPTTPAVVQIHTHCGIEYLSFGGEMWVSDFPGGPLLPGQTHMRWDDPVDVGEVTANNDGSITYTGRKGLIVRFVPAPEDYQPSLCY